MSYIKESLAYYEDAIRDCTNHIKVLNSLIKGLRESGDRPAAKDWEKRRRWWYRFRSYARKQAEMYRTQLAAATE